MVASEASVISNANNQSQPISGGLNGLGKNIKRFCLRRSFSATASRPSANLCLCARRGRPHTGAAVTASRSHFSEELLPTRGEREARARSRKEKRTHARTHACKYVAARPRARTKTPRRASPQTAFPSTQPPYPGINVEPPLAANITP